MDDKIDLSPEQNDNQNDETVQNRYQAAYSEGDSDDEFKDAQERPASATAQAPPTEATPAL